MGEMTNRLRSLRPGLKFLVFGGAAFWVPQILFDLWRRSIDGSELAVVNVMCPVFFFVAYAIVYRARKVRASGPSAAFYMLAGLWLLCPVFASVDFSFFGGGFGNGAPLASTLFAIVYATLFPPMTLVTAWFARQLFGFPVATLIMLLLRRKLEPERWWLPPAVRP